MPNVFVEIGDGVVVAAKDFLKFCDDLKLEAEAVVSPRAMTALAVLAVPLGQAVTDATAAAAQDGLNVPLDMETTELMIQTWPDLLAYLKTLKIQPTKGATK
jgi:hypothetical protein